MIQEPNVSDAVVIEKTKQWLEKAVIGLNLCPFAKSVHVKQQIHYAVCRATTELELLESLGQQILELSQIDANVRDTTLLIVPDMLTDFLDFNDFLAVADSLLEQMGCAGELQIASFHPFFQFAGTNANDVSNYTNRTPYPTLHLIREASIDRAVASFPDASTIYERNIEVLEALGVAGWKQLFE